MQELLFGTSSGGQTNNASSTSSSYSVQKPQPVRPSATSAFSAYRPAGRYNSASATSSPAKQQSYSSGYSGLDNLRSRTNYLTNLGSDERYVLYGLVACRCYQPRKTLKQSETLLRSLGRSLILILTDSISVPSKGFVTVIP